MTGSHKKTTVKKKKIIKIVHNPREKECAVCFNKRRRVCSVILCAVSPSIALSGPLVHCTSEKSFTEVPIPGKLGDCK